MTSEANAGPFLSVVIPCRNGSATLAKQLDALLAQTTSIDFEIVVADNGSTDDSATLVEQYALRDPRVRLVDAARRPGINVARNTGVRASTGRNVVLCDSDDVVQQGWLDAYGNAFAGGADCVGGSAVRVRPDGQVLDEISGLQIHKATGRPYPIGANCGFTQAAFAAVGGFDEGFAGGADEIDFFWRAADAGFVLEYVPDAIIAYTTRENPSAIFAQFRNYGRGNMRLIRRHLSKRKVRVEIAKSFARTPRWIIQYLTGAPNSARRLRGIQWLGFEAGAVLEALRTKP